MVRDRELGDAAAGIWNDLQPTVVSTQSFPVFKKRLNTSVNSLNSILCPYCIVFAYRTLNMWLLLLL